MVIIAVVGLLIVAAAVTAGVNGVLANRGSGHQLAGGFHAFDHIFNGSSGQLFFWGLIVGFAGMLGLLLLFGGIRGSMSRRAARPVALRHEDARPARHAGPAEPDTTLATTAQQDGERTEREGELSATHVDQQSTDA